MYILLTEALNTIINSLSLQSFVLQNVWDLFMSGQKPGRSFLLTLVGWDVIEGRAVRDSGVTRGKHSGLISNSRAMFLPSAAQVRLQVTK